MNFPPQRTVLRAIGVAALACAACNLVTGASDLVVGAGSEDAGVVSSVGRVDASTVDVDAEVIPPPLEEGPDAGLVTEVVPDGGVAPPPLARSADGGYLRVFLTSSTTDGVIKPSPDGFCTAHATDAGLGGTWRAWIATATENAATHVAGSGPWLLLDGTQVLANRQALLGNGLSQPIARTEKNIELTGHIHVWTAARGNGNTAASEHCVNWTSRDAAGRGRSGLNATGAQWTDHVSAGCAADNRVYCFEQ